ncbi:MAG: thiosulfate oxidation carrier complex protein SoxZ [Magnetospirillum sp.]
MPTPRVKMPSSAAKGDVFEVKTTIDHDMESGQRKDKDGKPIARKIIHKFTVTYNGKQVFWSDWAPAVSANPYCSFFLTATESGTIELKWHDDDGQVYSISQAISVA